MEIISQLYEYLSNNIFLVVIISALLVNTFIPASIIIMAVVGIFGSKVGGIIAYTIMILSSFVTYFIISFLNLDVSKILSEKHAVVLTKIKSRSELLSQMVIRSLSMPLLFQNIICTQLKRNLKSYTLATFLGSIPWVLLFVIFGDALSKANIILVFISIIIILTYSYYIKKIIDDS